MLDNRSVRSMWGLEMVSGVRDLAATRHWTGWIFVRPPKTRQTSEIFHSVAHSSSLSHIQPLSLSFSQMATPATSAPQSAHRKTPAEFLKLLAGRSIVVKLNSGVVYKGVLTCLDGYMNIAMEQTEEYVNGQLKHRYAETFIRGNNGA